MWPNDFLIWRFIIFDIYEQINWKMYSYPVDLLWIWYQVYAYVLPKYKNILMFAQNILTPRINFSYFRTLKYLMQDVIISIIAQKYLFFESWLPFLRIRWLLSCISRTHWHPFWKFLKCIFNINHEYYITIVYTQYTFLNIVLLK